MKEITTCEVINTEDKKPMTITTEWMDDDLKILLLRTGMTPLIGETSITEICKTTGGEKSRDQCSQEIRNELTGIDKAIQFSLRETKFIWKKKIWKKGTVEMKPLEDITILASMNIEWLSGYSSLQKNSFQMQKENEVLKKNAAEFIRKLEDMITMKKTMEDTLYNQFLILLNSKKRKIRDLEEKLKTQEISKNRSVYDEKTDESDLESDEGLTFRKKRKHQDSLSPVPTTSTKIAKTPLKSSAESDEEIVLRYDESQGQDFTKVNSDEEETEDSLFSQEF